MSCGCERNASVRCRDRQYKKPSSNCSSCKKQSSCGTSSCKTNCSPCFDKCHVVVDTYAEVQDYRNALVTVRDENAVYHVDSTGNPVAVSRSAIFEENHSPEVGKYKQNIVYDFINNNAYIYNNVGLYRTIQMS